MTTPQNLAKQLTDLASQVEEGCIVELGSYHGKGTVALAREAKVPVFTIDDYSEKRGWIGERYGPEDEEVFWLTVGDLEIIQLKMTHENAALAWEEPIGLLYWDPGVVGRFANDFVVWSPHIVIGGLFIIKDTPSNHLGTFEVIESAIESGDWLRFDYWMSVSFLRRMR